MCEIQRKTERLTHFHGKLSFSEEKMLTQLSQSNCHNNHSFDNISTIPDQVASNKSNISTVHWQYPIKLFNRKWIYRYLLTFVILMVAINSSPILLSNAQIVKSNRTSVAITQNFNNKIIGSTATSSSVTQKTSRNNRNNNIRKEYSNPDVEINERPGCHSCSLQKEVEADNLRSFKNHILQRLQLERAPNISMDSVTAVSESVLANFYSEYGERYIRRNGRNHEYLDEMMSDEPNNYRKDKNKIDEDDDDEDEVEPFFSTTKSVSIYPNGK